MAELRSFLIGVVVAGVLLGGVAVALGAFSSDDSDPPVARLLGSPVATATVRVTPAVQTTVLPTLAATTQVQPATPTQAAATQPPAPEPTSAPTSTPQPQPTADPVDVYLAIVQPIIGDLDANIAYVLGQGSANPTGSSQAANTIKALAGRMTSASPPSCLSDAHSTLSQASGQASTAADQLISALNASNEGLVNAALSAMGTARGTLGSGTSAVSAAPC